MNDFFSCTSVLGGAMTPCLWRQK